MEAYSNLDRNCILAEKNPLRYRGYYYDSETDLYYLQSRYYDPNTCRFVNADDVSCLGANGDIVSINLFAYCGNNPISRIDLDGDCWWVVGALTGFVIGGASSAISQYLTTGTINLSVVGINAISGAISGALVTTSIGKVMSIAANAILGGSTYIAEQVAKGEKVSVWGVVSCTLAGGIGGVIGGEGIDANSLAETWRSASQGIMREVRRRNEEYAAKQIAKYLAVHTSIIKTVGVAFARFSLGAVANSYVME